MQRHQSEVKLCLKHPQMPSSLAQDSLSFVLPASGYLCFCSMLKGAYLLPCNFLELLSIQTITQLQTPLSYFQVIHITKRQFNPAKKGGDFSLRGYTQVLHNSREKKKRNSMHDQCFFSCGFLNVLRVSEGQVLSGAFFHSRYSFPFAISHFILCHSHTPYRVS